MTSDDWIVGVDRRSHAHDFSGVLPAPRNAVSVHSLSVEEDEFMKRVFLAACLASACAVGLSAEQTPSTTTAQSERQGRMGGPMTLTGCVKAGDTSGTYMLTNIQRNDAGMGSGATTTGGATTTAGGATTTGGGSGMGQGMGRGMGQVMLNASGSDVDLSAHVGHKVEVTGTMSGGRGRMAGGAATTTGEAAGSTTTSGAAGATTTAGQGGGRGMRSMAVTSVKMISSDCGS
jgi:hypothetical protein